MAIFDFFNKKKEDTIFYNQRVPYKNQPYFNKFIKYQQESAITFVNLFNDNKVHPTRIKPNFFTIFHKGLRSAIAMYSSGRPIEEMKQEYLSCLDYFVKGWTKEVYESMLWMLSLGILLEIEEKEFDKLVTLLDNEQVQDKLLDYLVAYRKPNRAISEQVLFKRYYRGAIETTQLQKPEAEQRLKKYLEKEWYSNNDDSYWHSTHINPDIIYFGYWSFESGAIAKIMGLDDSTFKDNEYYPYDLVHWK